MKKADRKRLDEALDKALAPPKARPKQNLDALLDEYDEEQSPSLSSSKGQTPIGIPASAPTSIPSAIPTGIPASIPSKAQRRPAKIVEEPEAPEPSAPLDATHTGSEKSVYSIMYRETISKGVHERHFGPAELMKKTGIRSRNTVHKALYGLIEKLSVEVIAETRGNPLGPRYHVYKPQAIEQRRRAAGIKIDPQSKRITERGGIPAGIPESSPSAIAKNWDTTLPEDGIPTIPNIGTLIKSKENDSYTESDNPSSSSKSVEQTLSDSDDDAMLLEAIREVYERATGNTWTTADAITAQRGREISRDIWSIAICYCVDRAPGHTFQRLAYVLNSAREHAEMMKGYSKQDLRAIARHSLSLNERARATGKWTLAEIESEEGKAQN
jgi:hypothetical protein